MIVGSNEKVWHHQYDSGVSPTVDLATYSSIIEILHQSFDEFADRPAFSSFGREITYRELDALSKRFASFLQNELKLVPGERVALMMPNLLQYPVALFGILRAGLVAVNVNPLYTSRELEFQLSDSGAKAIVIFAHSAHVLEKIIYQTNLKYVVVTEVGDLLGFPKSLLLNSYLKYIKRAIPKYHFFGSYTFPEALLKGYEESFTPVAVTQEDTAFLQYTGGTTGVAKGAVLTHGNIIANVLQAKEWIKNLISPGKEIIVTPLPMYHIFSLTANCLIFFSVGALNVLIANPRDLKSFIKELKRYPFTALTGVNTLFNALLNDEDFKSLNFSSLKITLGGGMAVQQAVAMKWKEMTGVPLVEAYGLTETSPAVCINPMTLKDYNGYIGLPIPSTVVVIKDDEGHDLAVNEVGELCVKGPQVMKGYWGRPDETAKVMTLDGYFKTGDVGFMNEQGYVKIVDRKKDMILVSGFNVYPNEIEDVAVKHPAVLEAAAIGVPDERSGEAIKLFVVLKARQDVSEKELIHFCRENLTAYKVPRFVVFKKELPKSNVGKILRKELRG